MPIIIIVIICIALINQSHPLFYWTSGSPLSPKFPTVALQRRKSSAYVHGGKRYEFVRGWGFFGGRGGALRYLEFAASIYIDNIQYTYLYPVIP